MRTLRRVWRYQRGNQNQHVEEEQTTQWPKEKVQTNKQRFTKHAHKTKDRVTQTPLKTAGELGCSGRWADPAPLALHCAQWLYDIKSKHLMFYQFHAARMMNSDSQLLRKYMDLNIYIGN